MAIEQFSRIQHRRGTYTELTSMSGPLNTSELGHVIDQQRLFIGNGQPSEGSPLVGNTEIITDVTLLNAPEALKYVYRSNTGVVPQTGSTVNDPTIRSIGQILDDYVSVKSFGAVGDGITDDTAAINRAIQQLYTVQVPSNLPAGYRKLFFPAGVYIISGYVYLPPNCSIVGEGPLSTIIQMNNVSMACVVRTADSLFQNGIAMGSGGASLPRNIRVSDITLQHVADQAIVKLERASDVYFENVLMLGAWTSGSSSSASVYVDSLGAVYSPSNLQFAHCTFMNTYDGLSVTNVATNTSKVYFHFCYFKNQTRSIYTTNACSDFRISNSTFENVVGTVITASPLSTAITSSNNTYDSCGSVSDPVIHFQNNIANHATHCSSTADIFLNNAGRNVLDEGLQTLVLSTATPFRMQNITIDPLHAPLVLAGNVGPVTTGFTVDLLKANTAYIDYTILRGSSVRTGRINVYSVGLSPAQTVLSDLYSENSPTGIDFGFSISGNILSLVYTDTLSSATAFTLNIQPKTWLS